MNVVAAAETGVDDRKVHYYNLMLTTKEDAEFEQYGAMPSFEYPSEVKTVKDNVNFTIWNKNLVNKITSYEWVSNVGGTAEYIDDVLKVKPTGTSAYSGVFIRALNDIFDLINNKEITISFKAKADSNREILIQLSGRNTFNLTTEYQTFSFKKILTAVASLNFYSGQSLSTVPFYIKDLQVEINDKATDYVEHKEQNYTIPVQQEMLQGDKFEKVDGVWKEKHGWISLTENGSTNTMAQQETGTTGKYRYIITSSVAVKESATDQALAYCDKFKLLKTAATHSCKTGFTVSGSKIWIYDEGESLKDFKAKLADNPITFKLPLVTPTYINCIEEQIAILDEIEKTIHTYKEKTHIYSTDNFSPIFDVKVKKDTQLYIESQINSKLENINQVIVERS